MDRLFLGIDTSNYTTSVSIYSTREGIISNIKIPLPVEKGERGLRQSDAVFSHIKNAPAAAEQLGLHLSSLPDKIAAVGYSATPRPQKNSYMPCFLVGEAIACFIAASHNVVAYPFSHQEGHIAAAAYSVCRSYGFDLDRLLNGRFLSFHVSGGTFDLLLVDSDPDRLISVRRVGGTKDASAGQIIDRTGVKMGLRFPCGAEIDRLASEYDGDIRIDRVCVNGLDCNISGLENKTEELIKRGASDAEISAYLLEQIAQTLIRMTENAKSEFGDVPVLYAGGVMSSKYLKSRLKNLGLFPEPAYSSDNAAGIAVLTGLLYDHLNV